MIQTQINQTLETFSAFLLFTIIKYEDDKSRSTTTSRRWRGLANCGDHHAYVLFFFCVDFSHLIDDFAEHWRWIDKWASKDHSILRVESVNKFSHDAKIWATSTDSPEEIRMRLRRDGEDLSRSTDKSDLLEIVDGHTMSSGEPPISTSKS